MPAEEIRPPSRPERAAARVSDVVASWRFVGAMAAVAILWILVNVTVIRLDPFPTVMISGLAVGLSMIAATYGPLILLSQRAEARQDRARARHTLQEVIATEQLLYRQAPGAEREE